MNKYELLNNEVNDIIECYNLVVDYLKKSITSFESNIICSERVDKGILENEVKSANECIDNLNVISELCKKNIGGNNG